jgi:alpha,alpha-trehalose phosphorylase
MRCVEDLPRGHYYWSSGVGSRSECGMKRSRIYPIDTWQIRETSFRPRYHYRSESVFTLANGRIGMRGSFEEGFSPASQISTVPGTYLNGFYESHAIKYPEPAFGYAKNGQTMLNVTNARIILVRVDGEPFHLDAGAGEILSYERVLDLATGLLTRTVEWRSPGGCEIRVVARRLVSYDVLHLAAIDYTVIPLNRACRLELTARVDGDVINQSTRQDPRFGSALEGRVLDITGVTTRRSLVTITQRARHSRLALACAVQNGLETENPYTTDAREYVIDGEAVGGDLVYAVDAAPGQAATLRKSIAYVTTQHAPEDALAERAEQIARAASDRGFDALAESQAAYMRQFWNGADITISGEDEEAEALQQGIRFNMFHLLGAAGKDGRTNIGAKGLTGEGYEGHYFWDTEMFVVPFFTYVDPAVGRSLLSYRYNILNTARARAHELSHPRGAAFAWRTINGEEASAFFPAGTAQYHINADITHAIKTYVEATGDTDFLLKEGAEIVFETARLWVDLGEYVPARGNQFCIHAVTGPDEYTALVDNNCYTNLMAQMNLHYAVQVAAWLEVNHPEVYADLAARLSLTGQERIEWSQAATAMYIPYDANSGIYPADDGFLHRASWRWDWGTRDGMSPLLNRYHYLVVYRHQVCKQADLVLVLFLLGDRFTREEKRRNFNYYEQITTHDSSLSTCTFSILASEIGYHRRAYDYFLQTARMDLDDLHGNVTYGVHIANMAGTWMCLVNGFAGLRVQRGMEIGEGIPHYRPYLPEELNGYSFRMHHGDATVQISLNRDRSPDAESGQAAPKVRVAYDLINDGEVTLLHFDTPVELSPARRQRVFVN